MSWIQRSQLWNYQTTSAFGWINIHSKGDRLAFLFWSSSWSLPQLMTRVILLNGSQQYFTLYFVWGGPWAYRASCIQKHVYTISCTYNMYCIYLLCSWYPHCAWMCLVYSHHIPLYPNKVLGLSMFIPIQKIHHHVYRRAKNPGPFWRPQTNAWVAWRWSLLGFTWMI